MQTAFPTKVEIANLPAMNNVQGVAKAVEKLAIEATKEINKLRQQVAVPRISYELRGLLVWQYTRCFKKEVFI